MNALNSVIIEGTVAKEVLLMEGQLGCKTAETTVKIPRFYKDAKGEMKSEVSYIVVQSHGKVAEAFQKKAVIDREIRVVGRLKQERWIGEDGNWNSRVFIVVEHAEFKKMSKKEN